MSKFDWLTKACGIFLLLAAAAVAMPAQTLTTLHSFDGTDGYEPQGLLAQAPNGNLYGTTVWGGTTLGTIFEITPSGTLTTILNFDVTNGAGPQSGVILGSDGNFYGTTAWGGVGEFCCGTVFKLTPSGALTTAFVFCSSGNSCSDGSSSFPGLVQAVGGDFYGATNYGGKGCNGLGCGTIYKITPTGVLTAIYDFSGTNAFPSALIQGTDGYLYGVTRDGGVFGQGTIYKISPVGSMTVLYTFTGVDGVGKQPLAPLVEGPDGDFYGTTSAGGGDNNAGTIFKFTPSGGLTTLYEFCLQGNQYNCPDGIFPTGLTLATDGNFYGATEGGGAYNNCGPSHDDCGTVFRITSAGSLTTLYSFCGASGCPDGADPVGLMQDTNGTFYGITLAGGANNSPSCDVYYVAGCGTVFSLSMGLGPSVKTNPVAGKVGATVGILGTDLTGATSVKFNGTATAFRVVSSSFIEAKVPSGATTGTVQVQLPSGTLSSNVPFIVLP